MNRFKQTEETKLNLEAGLGSIILRIENSQEKLNENLKKNESTLEETQKIKEEFSEVNDEIQILKNHITQLEESKKELIEDKEKLHSDIKRYEALRSELNDEIIKKRVVDEELTTQIEKITNAG